MVWLMHLLCMDEYEFRWVWLSVLGVTIFDFPFEFRISQTTQTMLSANTHGGDHQGCLKCSCIVETCDKSGIVTKRQSIKKATVLLGRNDLNDVVMKISCPNGLTQGAYMNL